MTNVESGCRKETVSPANKFRRAPIWPFLIRASSFIRHSSFGFRHFNKFVSIAAEDSGH
jgi:hypothetical protein